MRLVIYILFIFLTIYNHSLYGQSTIAKLKFEDAETAYNTGDYAKAIIKLNEAEQLFGKANPPILHLRILIQNKQLDQLPNFNLLKKLNNDCSTFLKTYADVESLEDKYREVYKIQSGLEKYGSNETEFNKYLLEFEERKKNNDDALDKSNPAKIYILRHTGYGGSAVGFIVFVNGKAVCKLNNGNFTLQTVLKGKYNLSVQPRGSELKDKTDAFNLIVEPGKTYFLEVKMNQWNGKLRLEILNEVEGRKELARSKPDTCVL